MHTLVLRLCMYCRRACGADSYKAMAAQAGDQQQFAGIDTTVILATHRGVKPFQLKTEVHSGLQFCAPKDNDLPWKYRDYLMQQFRLMYASSSNEYLGKKKQFKLYNPKGDGACGYRCVAEIAGLDPNDLDFVRSSFSPSMQALYSDHKKHGYWLTHEQFFIDLINNDADGAFAEGVWWVRMIANCSVRPSRYSLPSSNRHRCVHVPSAHWPRLM